MIKIIGEINSDAYEKFSSDLDEALPYQLDKSKAVIDIELNSFGGEAIQALAIAAKIRLCRNTIRVTVFGEAASAAVIILAAGKIRRMTRESWAMVHEDSAKIKGSVVELEREAGHLRRLEDHWASILEEYTLTSADKWIQMHQKTTYLSAQECLKLGLIDEVV